MREFKACAKRIDIENRLYSDELGILAMEMRLPKFRLRDLRSHFRTQTYRARLHGSCDGSFNKVNLLEGRTSRPVLVLSDFLDQVYLPWSRANKKSWRDDAYTAPMLKQYFEGRALREISALLLEQFKNDRLNTKTKKGTARRPATVNRELTLLSSAFSLAVKYDKAESNPCSKVHLFTLDNLRYRYLLPEEEPKLMAQLDGPRSHLKPAVIGARHGNAHGRTVTNEAPSSGLPS